METNNLSYVVSFQNGASYICAELVSGNKIYYSKSYRYTIKTEEQCINYCTCSLVFNLLESMYSQRYYALEAVRRKYGLHQNFLIRLERFGNWLERNKKAMDFTEYSRSLKYIMDDFVFGLLPGEISPQRDAYLAKYSFIQSLVLKFNTLEYKKLIKKEVPKAEQMALNF